jgi:hypothetical protein
MKEPKTIAEIDLFLMEFHMRNHEFPKNVLLTFFVDNIEFDTLKDLRPEFSHCHEFVRRNACGHECIIKLKR